MATTEAAGTQTYVHDARGNIVYLPSLRYSGTQAPNVFPNYRDQMVRANLPTGGETGYYHFDGGGQRVRKVVRTGTHTERRYVGHTAFEASVGR